jgi:hypothetical protein
MGSNLSKADREKLTAYLNAATPYTDDEMRILDREEDFDRMRATLAKRLLQMDAERSAGGDGQ